LHTGYFGCELQKNTKRSLTNQAFECLGNWLKGSSYVTMSRHAISSAIDEILWCETPENKDSMEQDGASRIHKRKLEIMNFTNPK
jgi:hypothetical protein